MTAMPTVRTVDTTEAIRSINTSFERLARSGRQAARAAAARFDTELQPASWSVFREVLRAGPVQANALAADLGMDKSAVSRHLKELKGRGMISARRDERDARVVWLSATPEAAERATAANEEWSSRLHELFATWDPHEVESFAALLARFSEAESLRLR